jgi:hypothetical protein
MTKDHEKKYFFKYIPNKKDLKWNLKNIEVSIDPKSPIQIVSRYLKAF